MYCRNHDKRIYLCEKYNIIPKIRIKLLNNQIIPSDAGGNIKDEYVIFTVEENNKIIDTIRVGTITAIDFCNITKKQLPKLFNPLVFEYSNNDINNKHIYNSNNEKENETNIQLYNAIMLLIIIYKAKANTPLYFILDELNKRMYDKPNLKLVKSVNTIIKKSGKTLKEMINDLAKNNNIKDYKFNLLIDMLNKNNIEQYFE